MATNNSSNQDYSNESDGFILGGGTTKRDLTVTGADITLTGSGSNTYTFPASTGTLVSRDSTDTLTNKTLTSPILTTPALGTPSALVLTNATGLTNAGLSTTAGDIGGAYVTANPTFDVSTFDNGSGSQPTITQSKYTKIGKTVIVHFKISGTKAGTNGFIKTTAWELPTESAMTSGTMCGQAGYDNGSIYVVDMAVVYRSSGVWWICQTANINDNTSMPGLSGTFSYEAA